MELVRNYSFVELSWVADHVFPKRILHKQIRNKGTGKPISKLEHGQHFIVVRPRSDTVSICCISNNYETFENNSLQSPYYSNENDAHQCLETFYILHLGFLNDDNLLRYAHDINLW